VPKCPLTSAEMSWCRSVLVPKCLGSKVFGYRPVTPCSNLISPSLMPVVFVY